MSDRPRKGSKAAKRLASRIKAFDAMASKQGHRRPGSYKK